MTVTPADVLKQLALAAGYLVHVWDAVENGDAADSYFWKATGAGGAQSVPTFPSSEQAWRDCCEANGLLVPIVHEIEQAGCHLVREPGFIAYRWVGSDGRASQPFADAADALIACAIALADDQGDLEQDAPAPRA